MNDWVFLLDESYHWKAHVVHASLVPALKADLLARAVEDPQPTFKEQTPVEEAFFDEPGMCLIERSIRHVDVDGLDLQMPCQDWDTILYDLRLLAPRTFADGTTYYKLRGWRYCLVFTPAQRDAVLKAMEAQRDEANREGDADDQRFVENLNKVNEAAGHTVVVSARAEGLKRDKKGAN